MFYNPKQSLIREQETILEKEVMNWGVEGFFYLDAAKFGGGYRLAKLSNQ